MKKIKIKVEIFRQAMMDQASHCRWIEDNNVASAHVQPPLLFMVYNSWTSVGTFPRCLAWCRLRMRYTPNQAIRPAPRRTKTGAIHFMLHFLSMFSQT